MSMKALDDLRETLCKELDELARKPEMGAGDLELAHKLTDTIKNIDKICMMEEDGEYSRAGEWEADMRGSYGRGNSYANRGKHYVRGHYSRDDDPNMERYSGRRAYSRDGGREKMMEHLYMMEEAADNEQDREKIRRFREQLERG